MTKNANGKPPKSVCALYLKDVPRGLRDIFKAKCALKGRSMREALLQFMRDECREVK